MHNILVGTERDMHSILFGKERDMHSMLFGKERDMHNIFLERKGPECLECCQAEIKKIPLLLPLCIHAY